MTMTSVLRRFTGALTLAAAVAACGGDGGGVPDGARPGAASGAGAALTGAGATFPYPIYSRWFDSYNRATGTRINYQSIGSGGGIRQFTEQTVDFGATDGPMTDQQIAQIQGNVLHVPTVIGAVVITYNLPALGERRLRLDADAIAAIYMGQITKWNDPKIQQLNPGVSLPSGDIIVVHRSDGSGTTYVFTDYLAKISPEWQRQYGAGTSVNWPLGLGGKGNEGVTQQVKQTEGALGYVELIYATSNDLAYAEVRNAAGNFVVPTLASVTAAAEGALSDSTDFRVSITNPQGGDAYPIASFTWLLIPRTGMAAAKDSTLKDFLAWMISPEAQRQAADMGYAPLPVPVIEQVQQAVAGLEAPAS